MTLFIVAAAFACAPAILTPEGQKRGVAGKRRKGLIDRKNYASRQAKGATVLKPGTLR